MDFDIYQLDDVEFGNEEGQAAFEEYQEALLDRFTESPEGQERLKADPDMGFWAAQLIYFGWQYEGVTIPEMTVGDVRSVVDELFPRKISLESPEQADGAIPELLAFWKYLKREFHLPQADAILESLRQVEPDFPGMMNDPSNFGMAKSFFMMGQAAGFDMTSREGTNAFMQAYNASIAARRTPPGASTLATLPSSKPATSLFGTPRHKDHAKKKTEKKKRKRAAQARKKNRKRR